MCMCMCMCMVRAWYVHGLAPSMCLAGGAASVVVALRDGDENDGGGSDSVGGGGDLQAAVVYGWHVHGMPISLALWVRLLAPAT